MAIKWIALDKTIKTVRQLGKQFANLTVHLKKATPSMAGFVKRNFAEGGRPTKWKPKKDGSPSFLKDKRNMVARINATVEGNTIVVNSPSVQSAIHHFGGKTKATTFGPRRKKALAGWIFQGKPVFAKKVNHPGSIMPARPFMVIPENEMEIGMKIIAESIAKAAKL